MENCNCDCDCGLECPIFSDRIKFKTRIEEYCLCCRACIKSELKQFKSLKVHIILPNKKIREISYEDTLKKLK